ncbi:MAG: alpha/beta hydrolase-fold protein [Bacilli bacterium]
MKFQIINDLKINNLNMVVLSKEGEIIETRKLTFAKERNSVSLDYKDGISVYFEKGKIKTETVVLSSLIETLKIRYNKHNKLYTIDYLLNNNSYGKVTTFTLEDEKNLWYREDKKKNIYVWTPSTFSKKKKYKLMICFDGQNIFDTSKVGVYTNNHDIYGSWQVETSIESFNKNNNDNYIVVGVDNADIYRDCELTLNMRLKDFVELAQIEFAHCYEDGKEMYFEYFSNFIKETLIPFIKSKYPVKEEKITVVGSSSGGEASFYFGLQNMELVEKIFCFSSATATILPKVFIRTLKKLKIKKNKEVLPKLFIFQGGTGELESLLAMGNEYLVPLLKHYGYEESKIKYFFQKDSDHNEDSWRYAFNYFVSLINENK